MSGGYIVLIKNPPGGKATREIWFAHLGDMDKAVNAVETNTGAARSRIIVLGTIRHAGGSPWRTRRRGKKVRWRIGKEDPG